MAQGWVVGSSGSADSTYSGVLGPYTMSTSNYVQVRMLYKIYRWETSYQVWYKIQFHRTNTGHTTAAKVRSSIFLNTTCKKNHEVQVSTSNSTWQNATPVSSLDDSSFTVSLASTSTASITVGFATYSAVANLDTSGSAHSSGYPSSRYKYSGSITIPKAIDYTACGTPTGVSITDNGNGTFTISATAGSNGTSNATSSVDLYYTIDGSAPTTSNYRETFNIAATAGTKASKTISFTELSTAAASSIFGTDLAATVKLVARSRGAAGASYYSGVSSAASANFTWRGRPTIPIITNPPSSGCRLQQTYGFKASWLPPQDTANNTINGYIVYLVNKDSGAIEDYTTVTDASQLNCWLTAEASGDYCVDVVASCANSINSITARSNGTITVVPIVDYPAIDYHIDDYNCSEKATSVFAHRGRREKVYLDTGAGNICRICWNDVSPSRDRPVVYYVLVYLVAQSSDSVILDGGQAGRTTYRTSNTEFYITSEMLKIGIEKAEALGYDLESDALTLKVDVYGVELDSYISSTAGHSGTYFNVAQASGVLKTSEVAGLTKATRSIAFAKDSNDYWQPIKDFLIRDTNNWVSSDISFVSLLDSTGEPVVDANGEPVFIS